MTRDEAIAVLEHFSRVDVFTLRPGDVIVMTLETPYDPTRELAEQVQRLCTDLWPDHKTVVLAAGASLEAVAADKVPHAD